MALGEEADFEVLNFLPAPNLIRSTKLHLSTVGVIYIEFGYEKTKTYVIKNILMKYLNINDLETRDDNHKSQLLEWCQKNGKDINFATLSKFKLDKRDCFKVAIVIDGVEISTAEDFNKKSAEQTAANRAIEKLMIQNTLT